MASVKEPRKPISEQVVVVTGASSGVGRAIARAFGAKGAKLGLIARTGEALEHGVEEIEKAGGEGLALPLDVSNAKEVEDAAEAVEQRFGPIDTWVNDAVVSVFSPALETTPEEYQRVMDVNFLGYVHGTLTALRRMKARGGGIIQIGSALAYRSIPFQSAYCASKAAIRAFTDSLRSEILREGIPVHLSMLQLPAVNTPQFDVARSRLPRRPRPVPPIYQPEVIARACLYAAEHPVREMWLGPSVLKAILGQWLVPGYADRSLARRGLELQQTDELANPGRPDNLDHPLEGDRGGRGDFDDQARAFSTQIWMRTHPWLSAGMAGVLVMGLLRLRRSG